MVTEVYIPENIDRFSFCKMVKNKAGRCGIGYYSASNTSFSVFNDRDHRLHIRPCNSSGWATGETVGFELMKYGDSRIYYGEFEQFVDMLNRMDCFKNVKPTIAFP